MQGSSEVMTWTVQCLKEDKKVALTKTVPAAGILALPLNLELWLLPSSCEAAPGCTHTSLKWTHEEQCGC